MEPTLAPGDRLLVDRSAYRTSAPAVGDLVVFPDPADPSRWLVKRVAAVGPGRFQANRRGIGEPIPPGGEFDLPPPSIEAVHLPERSVYVSGDAQERSRDSREFGPVPLAALLGRAYRRYAPEHRRGDL